MTDQAENHPGDVHRGTPSVPGFADRMLPPKTMKPDRYRPRVVHLRKPGCEVGPACGYSRWYSETITTSASPRVVTCRRHGCKKAARSPEEQA